MKKTILFFIILFSIRYLCAQGIKPAFTTNELNKTIAFTPGSLKYKDLQSGIKTINMRTEKNKKSENNFIKKIYIKLYAGFGYFTPGAYNVSSINQLNWTKPDGVGHDSTTKTQAKWGIGRGTRYGFCFGIVKNDFLNIGLDAEYQHGNRVKNSLNTLVDDTNYTTANDAISYTAVTLTPHVIFKALARPKFYIYNKLGILLTLPFSLNTSGNSTRSQVTKLPHSSVWTQTDFFQDCLLTISDKSYSTYETKLKMSLGIGLNVAFGSNFRVTDKIRVFGEVFGNYSALSPASSLSNSYSKQHQISAVDTTNFHFEIFSNKYGGATTNYTTYKKGGAITIGTYQTQDLGIDNEGYHQYKTMATGGTSHKYTINMAVLGINVGFIYRF